MTSTFVSDLFDPDEWVLAPGAEDYTDITAHVSTDGGVARIAFNRPAVSYTHLTLPTKRIV